MRVLIVDDELLSRTALTSVLAGRSDVEHFDSACDAIDALDKLQKHAYDVLLLDINMPEMSGIELLEQLRKSVRPVPSIVFVTAHDEHAIRAFEQRAMDYVLKPFSSERITDALDIAFHRTESERAAKLVELLPQLKNIARRQSPRLAIKAKGRILFIDPSDVVTVQAQGNYVVLQRQSGSHLLRESISVIADQLSSHGFIRIHRSVLVNASYVEEVQPCPTGEYVIRLKGGKEYMVTRTYKKHLKSLADFWIGTGTSLAE